MHKGHVYCIRALYRSHLSNENIGRVWWLPCLGVTVFFLQRVPATQLFFHELHKRPVTMSGAGHGIETLKKNLVIAFRPECSILALHPFPTALICNQFVMDVYSTLTVTVSAF